MTEYGPFTYEGPAEERRAIAWMKSRLSEVESLKNQDQGDQIVSLMADLDDRVQHLKNGDPVSDAAANEDGWNRFLYCYTGVWQEESEENWQPPFEWGQWRLDSLQRIAFGYSDTHLFAIVPVGGGSSIHHYSKPPEDIVWRLSRIEQKSVVFFIGKARVDEIDAVCSVPQLPEEIGSDAMGLRVLDSSLGESQWQRRVDPNRIMSIRNFIAAPENIIANSVILYAPLRSAVSQVANGEIRIRFNQFLKNERGEWVDHSASGDLRPLWLIDGQHRVRALAQSADGKSLELPIILFPAEVTLAQAAKIFSEINTLQLKLAPLHTLFMQHRFGIPSPFLKRDFHRPYQKDDRKSWDSRANHLSYECAAYLTSHVGGPLFRRIKLLDRDTSRLPIIQAHQWVDFSRFWFQNNQIYGPGCDEDTKTIQLEVENYFSAIVETCNHPGWKDGELRWSENAKNKGLLQRQGPSQALLRLYPVVVELSRKRTRQSPIPVVTFRDVLRPLRWVDWIDVRLQPLFGASGERGRTMLRIWMESALRHGVSYSKHQVMSRDLRSKPGRGILSPPANGKIELGSPVPWPSTGKPVVLLAGQPENTLVGSKWLIRDSRRTNRSPEKNTIPAKDGVARLDLEYEAFMDETRYLDIQVDWYNTTSTSGKANLRLRRPRVN